MWLITAMINKATRNKQRKCQQSPSCSTIKTFLRCNIQCKDNKTEDYQQMELVEIFRDSNTRVLGINQHKIIHKDAVRQYAMNTSKCPQ